MSLGIGSMVRWSFTDDDGLPKVFKGRVVFVTPPGILGIKIGEAVVEKPAAEVTPARGRPPRGA